MSAPRKLAAILAADVVGYSRLTGIDEEGTLKRLRNLRRELINPAVSLHRGRIVKTTGDGILIEFPSVVDAVRCAIDVQREMDSRNSDSAAEQRIEFRVGINLGDVVIEGEDLLGDGVNVAARLEGISEPGGICISDAAYHQVRDKLDVNFEDAGEHQLKNIARPVRVYRLRSDRSFAQSKPALPLPDKPSIAVLAFKNLSNDVAQEYFVDGVVEDITTALSQFSQLFVVARSSSFTYKGRNVDMKQIGRELGVRYVLEGSIRKTVGHLRITVQLLDSLTSVHLWATRFDGALDQVFDFQDQVTSGVVNVIAPKIERAEIQRAKRKPPGSLDSYDYYLHGLANSYQDTKEASDQALRSFGRAIELDPDFAAAYGMAALCYVERWWKRWTLDPQKEVAEAARLVDRAAALGRNDALALSAAGMALGLVVRDLDQAVALLDRSLLLSPSLAASWVRSAWVRLFLGQFDLAIEHASRAMRLSPLDPLLVGMQTATAFAHFCAGRYEDAVTWSERALTEQANFGPAIRVLIASSASLDRKDDAAKWLARLKAISPVWRISEVMHFPFQDPRYSAKYAAALRKAGCTE